MTEVGVLYVFKSSFNWIAAPQLAIRELDCRGIVIEYVNLATEDANSRLNLDNKNCSPTLVISGKVLSNPIDIVRYLCRKLNSPRQYENLIKLLYCPGLDSNFAAISARNEKDLQSRFKGRAVAYLRGRQTALEQLAHTNSEHKGLYETKYSQNSMLVSLLENTASPEVKQSFFARSKKHWENVARFILVDLPGYLPENGFLGGGNDPGEADFHLVVWLIRTILVLGGTPSADGVKSLERELGGKPLPRKVQIYWETWTRRESWKYQFRTSFR